MKRFAILFSMMATACATGGPAVPALPGAGGPAWTELASAHFVVWTDAAPARAHEIATMLEDHRTLVLTAGLGGAETKQKTLAVVLRTGDEAGAFMPASLTAYAWSTPNPVRMPALVLAADTPEKDWHNVWQEHARAVTAPFLPHTPQWYAHGMASYFASAKVEANRASAKVGAPLPSIKALLEGHPTPVATLFGCATNSCADDLYFATSWALYSYLMTEHPAQLQAFTKRLHELPAEQWPQAWQETMPGETPDKLDHELAAYIAHGDHDGKSMPLTAVDAAAPERKLTDGDALTARALLKYMFAKDAAEARPAIDLAVGADKTNLVAQLLLAASQKSADKDTAKAVADAHPDDWRAWWLLGFAVQSGPEAADAREKLCSVAAKDPTMDLPGDLCAVPSP